VKAGHLSQSGAGEGVEGETSRGEVAEVARGSNSTHQNTRQFSREQVHNALMRATGLSVDALTKSTETDVKTYHGKELCKMGSTLHLFFKLTPRGPKTHEVAKELKALTVWYSRLKTAEPSLWRIVRCTKDFPSLKYNDITSCFPTPRETFLRLVRHPPAVMELAHILAEEAPNAIPDLHAILDDVCRAFLGELASRHVGRR